MNKFDALDAIVLHNLEILRMSKTNIGDSVPKKTNSLLKAIEKHYSLTEIMKVGVC